MNKMGKMALVLILVVIVSFAFAGITLMRSDRMVDYLEDHNEIVESSGWLERLVMNSGEPFSDIPATDYAVDDQLEMTLDSKYGTLDITSVIADLVITPVDGSTMRAHLSGEVSYRGDEKPSLVMRESGDHLILEVQYSTEGTINLAQGNLTLEIELPAALEKKLRLYSVSGEMTISGLTVEEVEARTVSGDVDIKGVLADEFSLESVSGNISLDQARLVSDYSIKTVSGNVSLRTEAVSDLEVDYSSISGEANYDFPFDTITAENDNRLEMTRGNGEYRLRVRSTSGNFSLLYRD